MTIEDMQLLSPGSKLIVGREYWLRSKETNYTQIMVCKESNGKPYFDDLAWATQVVPLAYLNWDIIGPLPIRHSPDFDAVIANAKKEPPPAGDGADQPWVTYQL